jgi:hypothetical protein
MTNMAGYPMKTGSSMMNYCGRKLGEEAIPGSDGQCGWDDGPQCYDCMGAPVPFIESEGEDEGEDESEGEGEN